MYNNVVFYNHGHLGDTLLSKPFINEVKKHIPSHKYFIANNYNADYVIDIVDGHIPLSSIPAATNMWTAQENDTLYFNTWFGKLNEPGYLELLGLSQQDRQNMRSSDGQLYNWANYLFYFNICLKVFDSNFDLMYMDIDKFQYLLPTPLLNVEIPHIHSTKTKILVFNQEATSGQSDNVDFTPYIESLAQYDVIIYTSQKLSRNIGNYSNIIQLPEYIQRPDLIPISSLSLYCDIICGPGNAPIISTWTRQNLQDPNKVFITINSNDIGEAVYFQETLCRNYVVKSTYDLFQILKLQLDGKHV